MTIVYAFNDMPFRTNTTHSWFYKTLMYDPMHDQSWCLADCYEECLLLAKRHWNIGDSWHPYRLQLVRVNDHE